MAKAKKVELDEKSRCYLFSSDAPAGRIFVGADAIAAAQDDGWKDSPVKSGGGKAKAKDAGK